MAPRSDPTTTSSSTTPHATTMVSCLDNEEICLYSSLSLITDVLYLTPPRSINEKDRHRCWTPNSLLTPDKIKRSPDPSPQQRLNTLAMTQPVLDIIKDKFHEFNKGYKHDGGGYVEMDKPRPCSYIRHCYENNTVIVKETITIGESIRHRKSPNGFAHITPMAVELRGITLHQLRAIRANVERRCEKEEWVSTKDNETFLTPDKVTLYDINKYIIKPYTEASESSFVETLPSTAGTQRPRFFVSHTWGETLFHTMDCIEQMSKDFKFNRNDSHDKKGGGMTEDTPIWICAFANNQHDLKDAITTDPSESGFAKAIKVANYRTLSILDKDGVVFTRFWCILELHLTLIKVQEKKEQGDNDVHVEWNGLWAVYTAHEHTYEGENRKAVGIVPGGAPCDLDASVTSRERPFPPDLILKGIITRIQTADASMEDDKRHILNFISGNKNLDATPPKEHEKYEELNDAVRGAFASNIAVLQSVCGGRNGEWKRVLRAMSKSIKKDKMVFSFEAGWDDLSAKKAVEMINHLPLSIEKLVIAGGPSGSPFMKAVIDWIEKSTNLKSLHIRDTFVGAGMKKGFVGGRNKGQDAGIRLAKTLAEKNTIEYLHLDGTDLMGSRNEDEWSKAFRKMTSLKKFYPVKGKRDDWDQMYLWKEGLDCIEERCGIFIEWLHSCCEINMCNVDYTTFDFG